MPSRMMLSFSISWATGRRKRARAGVFWWTLPPSCSASSARPPPASDAPLGRPGGASRCDSPSVAPFALHLAELLVHPGGVVRAGLDVGDLLLLGVELRRRPLEHRFHLVEGH